MKTRLIVDILAKTFSKSLTSMRNISLKPTLSSSLNSLTMLLKYPFSRLCFTQSRVGPRVGFSSSESSLSLIHISEPTRQEAISYAVFCLKKKIDKNATKCIKTVKIVLTSTIILMKSLFENKLHQTPSNSIFFIFLIFFYFDAHVKCVKIFIKI